MRVPSIEARIPGWERQLWVEWFRTCLSNPALVTRVANVRAQFPHLHAARGILKYARLPGRLILAIPLLLPLVGLAAFHRCLRQQDPTFVLPAMVFRPAQGDPAQFGRRVTFLSISPLTDLFHSPEDGSLEGIRSTIYTKIGSKPVPASGWLDIRLYEYDKRAPHALGEPICAWTSLKLPDSAQWGRWPLGGWTLWLSWSRRPHAGYVCLEAIYTNPSGKTFVARQGPIRVPRA